MRRLKVSRTTPAQYVVRAILAQICTVASRLGCWSLTVFAVRLIGSVGQLSNAVRDRFANAAMMSSKDSRTRNSVALLIRRDRDCSSDLNLWLGKLCWRLGELELARLLYRRTGELPGSSAQHELAESFCKLAQGILKGGIKEAIEFQLDGLRLPDPTDGPLIVVPVSSQYLELFDLWNLQCEKHISGLRLLLALDKPAVDALSSGHGWRVLDLSSHFVFDNRGSLDPYGRLVLWMLRVLILRELARRRYTIYSLDLDAVMVGDMRTLERLLPACDIIAQIDYSIPMDVARKLGFIVCCGLIVIRPSPDVDAFFDRYSLRTLREMNDQSALNHLLLESGIKNHVTAKSYTSFMSQGLTWVLPDRSLVSRDLGYGRFVRHFVAGANSVEDVKRALDLS